MAINEKEIHDRAVNIKNELINFFQIQTGYKMRFSNEPVTIFLLLQIAKLQLEIEKLKRYKSNG